MFKRRKCVPGDRLGWGSASRRWSPGSVVLSAVFSFGASAAELSLEAAATPLPVVLRRA